jgi:hypothetical protein
MSSRESYEAPIYFQPSKVKLALLSLSMYRSTTLSLVVSCIQGQVSQMQVIAEERVIGLLIGLLLMFLRAVWIATSAGFPSSASRYEVHPGGRR